MGRRPATRFGLTKALLAAIAGGASLRQALEIVAIEEGADGRDLLYAAKEMESDAFRKDVFERAHLEPSIVGVLLGRAKRERLKAVAELALEALKIEAHKESEIGPSALGLVVTAGTAMIIGLTLVNVLGARFTPNAIAGIACSLLALIAAGVALVRQWPVASRAMLAIGLLFPPVYFFLARGIYGRAHRPLFDQRRILLWIVCGEAAGVVPGAVIAALSLDVHSVRERNVLRKMELTLRGSGDAKRAAIAWLKYIRAPTGLIGLAELDLDGDSIETSARRLARLTALLPHSRGIDGYLPYIAIVLLALATYSFASFFVHSLTLFEGGLS